MQVYKTRARKFSGSDFHEVHPKAFGLYIEIKKKSKRRTYIRSAYFNKDKLTACGVNKNEKDFPLSVVYKPRPKAFFSKTIPQP